MKKFQEFGPAILTEREFIGSGPVGDLKRDTLYAVVLSVAASAGLYFVGIPLIALENIDAVNRTITTILGLLFPVLAIIYTFGFRDENPAIKELKRVGKFDEVISVFTISIAIIGLTWIYTFSITVFELHTLFGSTAKLAFAYTAVLAFFFVILRLWRCFQIFVLLNKAIRANE
ncbi:hypothetical protein [Haloarcula pellucida]|uniref:Uncharacterized protein n=1 Tax=Haloarcula pellucida TaxID=1427151 RepID=A0A830GMI2_9EURY|nr:hypothetical protein [Halomicroarcula pellucida]MBX0348791.1 hypothetical protein [Halomicroarcula pellucida]GGN91779.1 hypothetical protein GCM10009030_15180 [Halomicroarcula pellucida]